MPEWTIWIIVIIGMTIPVLIGALFNYFLNKKKVQAETESIKLKNKITENITYEQLQKESKQKDIKNKIEIFRSLAKLEEELKSKENKSTSDQKKLESLELIKKEFKETFASEVKEEPKLIVEEKNLETKKKSDKTIKSAKINSKRKNSEKKK